MKLITKEIGRKLDKQWSAENPKPVLKLFFPLGHATWLIAARDPRMEDRLYGLCDTGQGTPEIGTVLLSEIQSIAINGFRIERDRHFETDLTLLECLELARKAGSITAAEALNMLGGE